jgi:hypothetical protein
MSKNFGQAVKGALSRPLDTFKRVQIFDQEYPCTWKMIQQLRSLGYQIEPPNPQPLAPPHS